MANLFFARSFRLQTETVVCLCQRPTWKAGMSTSNSMCWECTMFFFIQTQQDTPLPLHCHWPSTATYMLIFIPQSTQNKLRLTTDSHRHTPSPRKRNPNPNGDCDPCTLPGARSSSTLRYTVLITKTNEKIVLLQNNWYMLHRHFKNNNTYSVLP